MHHLTIIGEAIRALSPDLRAQHSAVPWTAIIGMRNILVHHYFGIDVDVVWAVVERDLPPLKQHIDTILQSPPDLT